MTIATGDSAGGSIKASAPKHDLPTELAVHEAASLKAISAAVALTMLKEHPEPLLTGLRQRFAEAWLDGDRRGAYRLLDKAGLLHPYWREFAYEQVKRGT
jgi:hypothetical protein